MQHKKLKMKLHGKNIQNSILCYFETKLQVISTYTFATFCYKREMKLQNSLSLPYKKPKNFPENTNFLSAIFYWDKKIAWAHTFHLKVKSEFVSRFVSYSEFD